MRRSSLQARQCYCPCQCPRGGRPTQCLSAQCLSAQCSSAQWLLSRLGLKPGVVAAVAAGGFDQPAETGYPTVLARSFAAVGSFPRSVARFALPTAMGPPCGFPWDTVRLVPSGRVPTVDWGKRSPTPRGFGRLTVANTGAATTGRSPFVEETAAAGTALTAVLLSPTRPGLPVKDSRAKKPSYL